ncbi:IS110 family transposase [Clostridium sp. YIM B02555]|nr:IS110 family transposase [Clostridium sp. YIM B02555]
MQTNNIIKHTNKSTLIIGIDVAKYNSVARAFNSEGKELSKAITFATDYEGLNSFHMWINKVKFTYKLKDSII